MGDQEKSEVDLLIDSEPYEVLKDRGDVVGEQESGRIVDILVFLWIMYHRGHKNRTWRNRL